MSAYYNEIDPYAADWLRNLIAAGHIAPGDVDTRSIVDVRPADLAGYTQCHFFAGIGVWSYALRFAGWPDDRPIWTGSCPCQPFSAAGRGDGFADERHLWPSWHHLISECRPAVVAGEQVASKAVDPWIDLVQNDLEALGYAFGAVAFPSAGVGAPHIRDRTYFVADAEGERFRGQSGGVSCAASPVQRTLARQGYGDAARTNSAIGVLADANDNRCAASSKPRLHHAEYHAQPCERSSLLAHAEHRGREGREQDWRGASATLPSNTSCKLDDASLGGRREECADVGRLTVRDQSKGVAAGLGASGSDQRPGPTNGFWRDPDWLLCRDGRWRPVESGASPLAHGAPARVGRLRAYGNAINAQAAAAFIGAYSDLRAA